MALIRTVPGLCDTYQELTFKLIDMLPVGYKRIDIVADTYRERSLNDPERPKRSIANKVIVQSSSSKIPLNFSEFLKNGENKTRLIEIIKDVIVINKSDVLRNLGCQEFFILWMVYTTGSLQH